MSGYILHETRSLVVIATTESNNRKTGNMIQVWILRSDVDPVTAIKQGSDRRICGDCPARGTYCYVNVGQAPNAVFRAYVNGSYSKLELADYGSVFSGRAVRLGAYGDPAFIPQRVIEGIVAHASNWTGYTHQWRKAPWLSHYVMASVDSIAEKIDATKWGWRTFRVSATDEGTVGEIMCPASQGKTTCADCCLCNGVHGADKRKSIFIPVHGSKANHFPILA
jgi:uncharacterized low-complexity protein